MMNIGALGRYLKFLPNLLLHCCLSALFFPMFTLIRYFVPAFSSVSWDFIALFLLFACIIILFTFFSNFNICRIPRSLFLIEILLIWLILAGAFFADNHSPKKIGGSDGARYINFAYSSRTSTLDQIRNRMDSGDIWICRGINLFIFPAKISTLHARENQLVAYHRYLIAYQLIAILITAYATYFFLHFTTWKEKVARVGTLLLVLCPVSYFWVLDCQSDVIGIMFLTLSLALLSYLVKSFSRRPLTNRKTDPELKNTDRFAFIARIFKSKVFLCIKNAIMILLLILALVMAELTRSLGVFILSSIFICNFLALPHQIRRHRWITCIKIVTMLCFVVCSYFTILSAIQHYIQRSIVPRASTLSWLQFVNDESCLAYSNQAIFAKVTPNYPKTEVIRRLFCSCLKKASNPRWLNTGAAPVTFMRIIDQGNSTSIFMNKASGIVKNIQLLFILIFIIFPVFFGFARLCLDFPCWNQVYQIPILFSLMTIYCLFFGQNIAYHGVLWFYLFPVLASFFFSYDWERSSAPSFCCRQLFFHVCCFLVIFGLIWAVASRFCPPDFRIKDFSALLSRAGLRDCRKGFHQIVGVMSKEQTNLSSTIVVKNLQPNRLHYCSFIFLHSRLDGDKRFNLTVCNQAGEKIYFYDSNTLFFDYGSRGRRAAPPVFRQIASNDRGECIFTIKIEKTGGPFPLELRFGPLEIIPSGITAWINLSKQ